MANTLNLGNGNWATKEDSLLAYNSENGNFKPLPFDFTRATSATVINKDGLIETVGSGEPRIDFLGNTKGALKLEPSRTNLVLTSASGTYGNSPASETNTISPDGTNNAVIPTPDSNSDRYEYSIGSNTYATDTKLVYSWYRKRISTPIDTSYIGDLYFNVLINATQVGSTTQIQSDVNGFDRFQAVFNITDGSASSIIRAYFGYIVGVGNSSVAYFGHQLEVGSYATSYIPTQGGVVTRNQDSCSNGGNEQVINSTEGVLYVETKGFTDLLTQSNYIQLSKNGESSATNSLIIQHRNNGYLRVYVNGFATSDIQFNVNIDFTENHKIAVLYKLNGYKLFIDGVAQNLYGTPTQAVFSGLDNLSFDLRGALSWNASIKDVKLYNTALTDAELQALTTL